MKKYCTISRNDEFSKEIEKNIQLRMEKERWVFDKETPDFIFVIGGDGTFLHAVHSYLDKLSELCFIGIHTGTLGFFTDYQSDELEQFYNDIFYKNPTIQEYRMLKCQLSDKIMYGLNEVRVENVHKTQLIDVYINKSKLERFRGTGLCVCTQLGSTAYNRSLNGAVIQNELELLELCEITGIHHREYRSLGSALILHPETEIIFHSSNYEGAVLCWDQYSLDLREENEVKIQLSNKKVKIARYRPYDYINHLKNLF